VGAGRETPSCTRASRAPTNGTTGRLTRGNSRGSGTSSRLSRIRRSSTRASRTRRSVPLGDGGMTWNELAGLRGTARGRAGSPAREGCACTPSSWTPPDEARMFIAISAAGAFRTDDGGATWKPINRGLRSEHIPDPDGRGRALRPPYRHAPVPPERALHAEALGRHAQRRRRRLWREVSGNLPSDFGFPIEVHAHEPETVYVVPIKSDSEHFPPDGRLRVYRSRTGGGEWEALTAGLPQRDCYVNVLRDAMAVDSLDSCGVYFGTTGGQVYVRGQRGLLGAHRARPARRALGRGADASMIKVMLPAHLRNLAGIEGLDGCHSRGAGDTAVRPGCHRVRLSDASRHDSRPDDKEAPRFREVFRLRARCVP
jgi:hypothetical protein